MTDDQFKHLIRLLGSIAWSLMAIAASTFLQCCAQFAQSAK